MIYFIVDGLIILFLFLLMIPFKTEKARGFLINLMLYPCFISFVVWLQITMIKNISDEFGLVMLSFAMYAISAMILVFFTCSIFDRENLGILIVKEYNKSKEIPLMTKEQIEQEAKIRLQMERLKDTLTFTERELEAKKYVESLK